MMVDAVEREDELEEVTDVLLVTRSDDFNTVAAAGLRPEVGHGHVFRVAPDPAAQDLLPPASEGGILGNRDLTFAEISRRFAAGARFVSLTADQSGLTQRRQGELLCAVSPDGRLSVVTEGGQPAVESGHTMIYLVPPVGATDQRRAVSGWESRAGTPEARLPGGRCRLLRGVATMSRSRSVPVRHVR